MIVELRIAAVQGELFKEKGGKGGETHTVVSDSSFDRIYSR